MALNITINSDALPSSVESTEKQPFEVERGYHPTCTPCTPSTTAAVLAQNCDANCGCGCQAGHGRGGGG